MPNRAHVGAMCSTAMVRAGAVLEMEALSELGVFGTFLSHRGELILNKQVHHLPHAPPPSQTDRQTVCLPVCCVCRSEFMSVMHQPKQYSTRNEMLDIICGCGISPGMRIWHMSGYVMITSSRRLEVMSVRASVRAVQVGHTRLAS